MQNRKIITLTLAIFSMSILFMFDYIVKPVNAVSSYNISVTENIGVDTHTISGVAVFTSIDNDDGTYKTWRASDGTVLYSGSADDACTAGALACTYNNLECSGDTCWFHADVTSNDRLVILTPSTGVDTICVATGEASTSNEYLRLGGFLYIAYTNGANEKLRQINTASCDPLDFVDTADLNVPAPEPIAGTTISGTSYIALSGNTILDIINVSTMTVKCQFGTVDNYLGGIFHNGNWYIGEDSGSVRVISNSCGLVSTITSATLDNCGTSQDVESNGGNLIFVACDTAGTNNRVVVYNTTSNSVLATYLCAGNSAWGDTNNDIISYSSVADAVACSTFDQDIVKTVLQQGSGAGSGQSTVCIDTNLDGVTDLCFTDSNNDGVADNGFAGGLGAFTSNANITDIGTDWFCAFNLGGACTNPNVKTNGVGIFYLIIIIIFSYAILVAIHIKAVEASSAKGVQLTDALKINPVLLLVMLMADVGFAWYLNFIENTIFYSVIAILVGLAGFGIYKQISRSES